MVLIWMSVFLSMHLPANRDSQRIAGLSIIALVMAMLLCFASDTAKKIVNGCPEFGAESIRAGASTRASP